MDIDTANAKFVNPKYLDIRQPFRGWRAEARGMAHELRRDRTKLLGHLQNLTESQKLNLSQMQELHKQAGGRPLEEEELDYEIDQEARAIRRWKIDLQRELRLVANATKEYLFAIDQQKRFLTAFHDEVLPGALRVMNDMESRLVQLELEGARKMMDELKSRIVELEKEVRGTE